MAAGSEVPRFRGSEVRFRGSRFRGSEVRGSGFIPDGSARQRLSGGLAFLRYRIKRVVAPRALRVRLLISLYSSAVTIPS